MTCNSHRSHVIRALLIASAFAISAGLPAPASGHVQVGVQIGVPPPVIVSPPPFVVVPTTPAVQYAPNFGINVFLYGGHYYAWNDGAWFIASNPGQPWTYVEPARVPRPVLVVPARYYNVPPGHWKKRYGHGHGHYDHHGDHDD